MIISYFDPFYYKASTISKTADSVLMADIFKNYKHIFDTVAKNYKMQSYIVQGAPRPEQLSYEIYGNTQYYWALLYANNVYDPYHGWIKTRSACYESAKQKYGEEADKTLYHVDVNGNKYYNLVTYDDRVGIWYDKGDILKQYPQFSGALAGVSAYEHELLENEYKRKIRIITPYDMNNFMSDFLRELEKVNVNV